MNEQPYFGWYSQEAAENYGSVIYVKDGVNIECTTVAKDPNYQYGFKDAVFLGEVGQYSHKGRHGTNEPRQFTPLREFDPPFTLKSHLNYPVIAPEKVQEFIDKLNASGFTFDKSLADVKKVQVQEECDQPTVLAVEANGDTVVVSGGK